MSAKDRVMNFVYIAVSISVMYVIVAGLRSTIPLSIYVAQFVAAPAGYALYAFLGRKFIKQTTPFLWVAMSLILLLPLGKIYNALSFGSLSLLFEYLSGLRYIMSCILSIWLNCMSAYLIEWVMTSKEDLMVRRFLFRKLAIVATVCLLTYPIFFVAMGFEKSNSLPFVAVAYALWAGSKLPNAFGGISDQECQELYSSRTEGTTEIDTYEIHTGEKAVLFGLKSALIWLGLGPIVMLVVLFIYAAN